MVTQYEWKLDSELFTLTSSCSKLKAGNEVS